MYSGTTFRKNSGGFIGVHQRIDRIAYRNLLQVTQSSISFPSIGAILHFEGNNGPDGIKRKSPSVDEPWHYIDPSDPSDTAILTMIDDHIENLASALRVHDETRAAFEAAWLAHTVVDGLTPAHHYPLSEKIEELWGKPKEERISVIEKNVIKGETHRETVSKNWEYWGAKGIFSTHVLFELGVATSIKATRFRETIVEQTDMIDLARKGFITMFLDEVHHIYGLDMYEEFWKKGWSAKLARQTRRELIPTIVRMVTLAWCEAIERAEA